jgi:prolyl 4-hydroxylase
LAGTEALEQLAQGGDPQAQLALAQLLAGQGRHEMARGWYARLFQGGDRHGLRLLAISLMQDAPLHPEKGVAMIKASAAGSDSQAQLICACLAAQDDALDDHWAIALRYLTAAAAGDNPTAQAELEIVGTNIAHLLTARGCEGVSADPRILVIRGFASAPECDWLVEAAQPRLRPAQIYDPQTGEGLEAGNIRNNSAAAFGVLETGLLLCALRSRLKSCLALDGHEFEPPMVLRYETGQQFAPHFDFIDPDQPGLREDIRTKGQRVATLLIYLNDDYTGGQTNFDVLDYAFKGAKGDALIFWNTDAQGHPDRRTRHAGMAPLSGEKWILSQWIRWRDPASSLTPSRV